MNNKTDTPPCHVLITVSGAVFDKEGRYRGSAKAGKDTFVSLLRNTLGDVERIAVADRLKWIVSSVNLPDGDGGIDDIVRSLLVQYFDLPPKWKWDGEKDGSDSHPSLYERGDEFRKGLGRRILQKAGEFMRSISSDALIDSALHGLEAGIFFPMDEDERNRCILDGIRPVRRKNIPEIVVISDARFSGEVRRAEAFAYENNIPIFLKVEVLRESFDNGLSLKNATDSSEARVLGGFDEDLRADFVIWNRGNMNTFKKSVEEFARSLKNIILRTSFEKIIPTETADEYAYSLSR